MWSEVLWMHVTPNSEAIEPLGVAKTTMCWLLKLNNKRPKKTTRHNNVDNWRIIFLVIKEEEEKRVKKSQDLLFSVSKEDLYIC